MPQATHSYIIAQNGLKVKGAERSTRCWPF